MKHDYVQIFDLLRQTLKSQAESPKEFDKAMVTFVGKHGEYRERTDDEYHWIMTCVGFYSGMRARTVKDRLDAIRAHLYGVDRVSKYSSHEIKEMMNDQNMLRNSRKTRASIENAKLVKLVSAEHGSFHNYIDSFDATSDQEGLIRLRDSLRQFKMIGRVTVYHFMMDIGLPVLKPDRVVLRTMCRLGLLETSLETEGNIRRAISVGKNISAEVGCSTRELDVMLVLHGQTGGDRDFGIGSGICLKNHPRCKTCALSTVCRYHHKRTDTGE